MCKNKKKETHGKSFTGINENLVLEVIMILQFYIKDLQL